MFTSNLSGLPPFSCGDIDRDHWHPLDHHLGDQRTHPLLFLLEVKSDLLGTEDSDPRTVSSVLLPRFVFCVKLCIFYIPPSDKQQQPLAPSRMSLVKINGGYKATA